MEKTKLTLPLLNGHLTQSASAAATASQASTSSANPSRNANPITTTITSSASASNRHLTSEQRKISSVHQGSISSQSYNTDHQGKSPSVLHHHISKSKLCCKCKSSVISSGSSINESVNPSIIDPLISPRPCTVFKVTEWKADFGKSKVTCSLCRQKFIVDHAASHWLSRHATAHQLAVSELQEFMQGRLWAQVDPSRAAARGGGGQLNELQAYRQKTEVVIAELKNQQQQREFQMQQQQQQQNTSPLFSLANSFRKQTNKAAQTGDRAAAAAVVAAVAPKRRPQPRLPEARLQLQLQPTLNTGQ